MKKNLSGASKRKTEHNKDLELATQIMSGLLASGHYTYVIERDDDQGKVVNFRRHFDYFVAVEDALFLLAELEKRTAATR